MIRTFEEFNWNPFRKKEMDVEIEGIVNDIISNFDYTKLDYRREQEGTGRIETYNLVFEYDYNGVLITPSLHCTDYHGVDAPPPDRFWFFKYNGKEIRYKLSKSHIKKLYRFFRKMYKKYEDEIKKHQKEKSVYNKEIDPYNEEKW
jgi:hypothetical protein